ncbi:Aste57867_9104 [Aphanomyces stellatus]|uniref:Aste57867_9104 protein n=1 Tax=Aphanomyces stellatus TaxID=120398 RepID=A0A485KM75_9STRA|nr:hypothetical protein As57867_009068 [Aphanomyces stellatus]VFT85988.1 Aste57867_9104 [Aphanomyces stellatus]
MRDSKSTAGIHLQDFDALGVNTFALGAQTAGPPPLDDKYASEVACVFPCRVLTPDTTCTAITPSTASENVHVDEALSNADTLRDNNLVLLLLNGRNEGILMEWFKASGCLHALAHTAASVLGADPASLANGVRLYNSNRSVVTTADELDVDRLAYILVDFQVLVWPGIHVGYTRVLADSSMTLTTRSFSPLVFDGEGRESIGHLAATKPFSANVTDEPLGVLGRHAVHAQHSEMAQVVRYTEHQLFRKHYDYFRRQHLHVMTWHCKDGSVGQNQWCALQSRRGVVFPSVHDKLAWQHNLFRLVLTKAPTFFDDHGLQGWDT